MKTTITFSANRTYSLGNYENYKPMVCITEEYNEGEEVNYDEAFERVSAKVNEVLAKEAKKIGR